MRLDAGSIHEALTLDFELILPAARALLELRRSRPGFCFDQGRAGTVVTHSFQNRHLFAVADALGTSLRILLYLP